MSVLITGGAGYIGSHMVLALLARRERVVVLDNLSSGHRALVPSGAIFVEACAGDYDLVSDLIKRHSIETIIHFAGSIIVPESVGQPLKYYANNTQVSRNLIEAAICSNVRNFIFSSTAAVYQGGCLEPIDETWTASPISPYGRSKLMTEWMLQDASKAYNFRYVALRYFNVAGADPDGRSGQMNPNATHLIKRATQVALGHAPHLEIFGTDYPTQDGTGVRDYIHVSDLVEAHALAVDYLRSGGASTTMNCGYGHGSSVREVIRSVEKVVGHRLTVREAPRRLGDVACLVANPCQIRRTLGWAPQYDDLDEIVLTAYRWELGLNNAAQGV